MIRNIYLKLVLIISISNVSFNLKAQDCLTNQLMYNVCQSNYSNPAFIPCYSYHMSIPFNLRLIPTAKTKIDSTLKMSPNFISPTIYFRFSTTLFSINDIFKKDANDSLHINTDNALKKVGKVIYTGVTTQIERLSFGFKLNNKKDYINFTILEKFSMKLSIPKDFLSLLVNGNTQFIGKTASFNGFGINEMHYLEYGCAFAHTVNKKLTVGIKPKLLFGLSDINTYKNSFGLYTDPKYYYLTTTSGLKIRTSLPMQVNLSDGNINSIKKDSLALLNYYTNRQNKGYAIDLGATYKLTNKITLNASVIDLGFITWKANTQTFDNVSSQFTFEGIDISQFFNNSDTTKNSNPTKKLTDSISKSFKFTKSNGKYTTSIGTKIIFSGVYQTNANNNVGVLIRNEFYNNSIHTAFTASLNSRLGKFFSTTFSYSIFNRSYNNFGLGICFNLGFFQFYCITDNFLPFIAGLRASQNNSTNGNNSYYIPSDMKNANLFFGMNLVFGCKKKKPNLPQI